ncbi:MAG: ATP-binding cassette domain-containing protein [Candidatus Cloacimonadota bacterium]|nr:MAG: ATP-binding cassette domain-containing protein [Candidatus Cloacimonadota bacterium]
MRIVFRDVSFCYNAGLTEERNALRGISLAFEQERCYLITGPCGSGKTTIALLLKGLVKPTAGSINIENAEKSRLSFQREIGFTFQFPEEQFFKDTVEEEVSFGPVLRCLDNIEERVRDVLNHTGLPYNTFRYNSPFGLSSGEQRKLAIASVAVCEPSWYIFDEPTAGLDFEGREKISALIHRLVSEKKTVIIITQELERFLAVCDEIVVFRKGELVFKEKKDILLEKEDLDEVECILPYHMRVLRELRRKGWSIPVSIGNSVEAAKVITNYKA